MTQQSQPSAQIVLHEDPGLGQIRADLDAYIEFRLGLAQDLEALVARWIHAAAPKANRAASVRKALRRS